MTREAFFLQAEVGQRFCVLHLPDAKRVLQGAIVYLHPFAEEMNRSRRIAAEQSTAFVNAGYAVLQVDLYGCGDSSGDFEDATWAAWVEDGRMACEFLAQRFPAPLWLWGLRSGALLAGEVAREIDYAAGLLLWQPWLSGKQGLQQFLRIAMAAELLDGDHKAAADRLRDRLNRGESIEVSGYTLSSTMARGLEKAELLQPGPGVRFEWLEFSTRPQAELSPGAKAMIDRWQTAGHLGRGRVAPSVSFWQTLDAAVCPALTELSVSALGGTSCS